MDFTNRNHSRVWRVNDRNIEDIVFYSEGNVIAKMGQAWIEHEEKYANSKSRGILKDIHVVPEIEEVKNARTVNLNRTDCFVHKGILYIYGPLLKVTEPKPGVATVLDSTGETKYLNYFNIEITVDGEKKTLLCSERYFLDIDGRSAKQIDAEEILTALGVDIHDINIGKVINALTKNLESILDLVKKF